MRPLNPHHRINNQQQEGKTDNTVLDNIENSRLNPKDIKSPLLHIHAVYPACKRELKVHLL